MRLLSPLCSPRVFCANGAENLNSRRTNFYIVLLYAAVLCAPSPRVFRAVGAENLNSRRTSFYIVLLNAAIIAHLRQKGKRKDAGSVLRRVRTHVKKIRLFLKNIWTYLFWHDKIKCGCLGSARLCRFDARAPKRKNFILLKKEQNTQ